MVPNNLLTHLQDLHSHKSINTANKYFKVYLKRRSSKENSARQKEVVDNVIIYPNSGHMFQGNLTPQRPGFDTWAILKGIYAD